MPKAVNIHEAKTHFSRLVERAAKGEVIFIARAGRIRISKNFDAPLPRNVARAFERKT
jgi:hypothetical protein